LRRRYVRRPAETLPGGAPLMCRCFVCGWTGGGSSSRRIGSCGSRRFASLMASEWVRATPITRVPNRTCSPRAAASGCRYTVAHSRPVGYVCGSGEQTARRVLTGALAVWSAKYPHVEVFRHVCRGGDPAAELIDASHGAQLAIVGRHDRYGLPRRILGAVAGQLLDRAGCSVAVVGHR